MRKCIQKQVMLNHHMILDKNIPLTRNFRKYENFCLSNNNSAPLLLLPSSNYTILVNHFEYYNTITIMEQFLSLLTSRSNIINKNKMPSKSYNFLGRKHSVMIIWTVHIINCFRYQPEQTKTSV